MEAFEALTKQDQATAISKRFDLGRNLVLSATQDSMKAAWGKGDKHLLLKADGSPLLAAPTPSQASSIDVNQVRAIASDVAGKLDTTLGVSLRAAIEDVRRELHATKRIEIITPKQVKVQVGPQHRQFEKLLKLIALKMNIWIGGEAGSGKTHAAHQAAKVLGRKFYRISCGPQTAASLIFGHTTAHGGYAPGIAYQALTVGEEGAVLLLDEYDRMNPAVAVMCNGLLDGTAAVTFPNGESLERRPDVTFVVAANTFGKPTLEFGTAQRQDSSTMSRFVRLPWGVDEDLERAIFGDSDWVKTVQLARRKVAELGITSVSITPRASEYGVMMLANGFSKKDALDMLIFEGMGPEDKKKLSGVVKA